MKIAVVGSGISGLSAAYYLSKKHHVDLFEREDHFGGHSQTIDIYFDEKKVSIDIGFIVFNFQTYPNLIISKNIFKKSMLKRFDLLQKIPLNPFPQYSNFVLSTETEKDMLLFSI